VIAWRESPSTTQHALLAGRELGVELAPGEEGAHHPSALGMCAEGSSRGWMFGFRQPSIPGARGKAALSGTRGSATCKLFIFRQ